MSTLENYLKQNTAVFEQFITQPLPKTLIHPPCSCRKKCKASSSQHLEKANTKLTNDLDFSETVLKELFNLAIKHGRKGQKIQCDGSYMDIIPVMKEDLCYTPNGADQVVTFDHEKNEMGQLLRQLVIPSGNPSKGTEALPEETRKSHLEAIIKRVDEMYDKVFPPPPPPRQSQTYNVKPSLFSSRPKNRFFGAKDKEEDDYYEETIVYEYSEEENDSGEDDESRSVRWKAPKMKDTSEPLYDILPKTKREPLPATEPPGRVILAAIPPGGVTINIPQTVFLPYEKKAHVRWKMGHDKPTHQDKKIQDMGQNEKSKIKKEQSGVKFKDEPKKRRRSSQGTSEQKEWRQPERKPSRTRESNRKPSGSIKLPPRIRKIDISG